MRNEFCVMWLLLMMLLCVVGCSQEAPLHPASGKVLLNGQPLAGATVMLHPAAGTEGGVDFPTGQTKADGTFSLSTSGSAGAAAGQYKVTVVCMETPKGKSVAPKEMSMGPAEQEDRLKGAYADLATSKFSVEIKSGLNQLEPFVLQ